jgi:hypothetical protein
MHVRELRLATRGRRGEMSGWWVDVGCRHHRRGASGEPPPSPLLPPPPKPPDQRRRARPGIKPGLCARVRRRRRRRLRWRRRRCRRRQLRRRRDVRRACTAPRVRAAWCSLFRGVRRAATAAQMSRCRGSGRATAAVGPPPRGAEWRARRRSLNWNYLVTRARAGSFNAILLATSSGSVQCSRCAQLVF